MTSYKWRDESEWELVTPPIEPDKEYPDPVTSEYEAAIKALVTGKIVEIANIGGLVVEVEQEETK